jgi:ribosomal protein S18 acetylase RimI-like enzyme
MKDILTQKIIDDFVANITKIKLKNKIKDLKIEYCCDDKLGKYIYLTLITIKKSQRCKGYGSYVISEIIKIADEFKTDVVLFATNIYGSELNRLVEFYRKHGFSSIKNDFGEYMKYSPKKRFVNKN